MPALNFKSRFAGRVTLGSKRRTIRAWRKRPFRAGDKLSFFTGMRTKSCRRLREDAVCLSATRIEIHAAGRAVRLDGKRLTPREVSRLARADGFDRTEEFWTFFQATHGNRLRGQLIAW